MAYSGVESAGFKLFGKVIVADENRHIKSSPQPPPRLPTACPRCNSHQTKFCYFNNYNVNQPRHFCKACHRYWTAGGALRNVPVGAGRRRSRLPPRAGSDSLADERDSGSECSAEAEPWMLRREQLPASGLKLSNPAGESC